MLRNNTKKYFPSVALLYETKQKYSTAGFVSFIHHLFSEMQTCVIHIKIVTITMFASRAIVDFALKYTQCTFWGERSREDSKIRWISNRLEAVKQKNWFQLWLEYLQQFERLKLKLEKIETKSAKMRDVQKKAILKKTRIFRKIVEVSKLVTKLSEVVNYIGEMNCCRAKQKFSNLLG